MATQIRRRTRSTHDTARTCRVSMRAHGITRRNARIVRRTTDRVHRVTTGVRRSSALVTRLNRHSRRVAAVIGAVHTVTSRAGLLTLGTTVRTTQTNRRNHNFTIITSRIQLLTTQADNSATRVSDVVNLVLDRAQRTVGDVSNAHSQTTRKIRLTGRTKAIVLRVHSNTDRTIRTIDVFTGRQINK